METRFTSNYDMFSLHEKNRRVNLKKVERLAEKMRKKNLLHLFPIIVNKRMEILDGQHRFEAAKLAKATVFYFVSDELYDISNVAETNNFQSHWKLDDYVNYYAKEKRDAYVKILELSKKYRIQISCVANLSDNKNLNEEIRAGEFKFEDYNEVVDLIKHCKSIGLEYGFEFWNKRAFLRAMKRIMQVKGYNKLRMAQKIQKNRRKLVKCGTADVYISVLEDIYNTDAIEVVRFF